MKFLAYFILMFMYTAIMSRYYYVKGLNDSNFDRVHANNKLQECLEVIRK